MGENETGIYKQYQITLNTAKEKLVPNRYNKTILLVSIIASIFFLSIMVMTKLWPCFEVSWSQDFCNRWNDFWFSLSASIVAAIIFFVIFTLVPSFAKRREMEQLISNDIQSLLSHMNTMMAVAIRKYFDFSSKKISFENFYETFMSINWLEECPDVFDGMNNKPFLHCLLSELDHLKRKLNEINLHYSKYFNNDEINILNQDLLNNIIFERAVILKQYEQSKDDLNETIKEETIKQFYNFFSCLVSFAYRFRAIDELPSFDLLT